MTISTSAILDRLAEAVSRYRLEGDRGTDWVWFCMSADEHLAFDLFLVRMNDSLAYEAGAPESRFRTRVRAMATGDYELGV